MYTSTVEAAPLNGGGETQNSALQDQQQRFVRCVKVSDGTLDCKTLSGKGTLSDSNYYYGV